MDEDHSKNRHWPGARRKSGLLSGRPLCRRFRLGAGVRRHGWGEQRPPGCPPGGGCHGGLLAGSSGRTGPRQGRGLPDGGLSGDEPVHLAPCRPERRGRGHGHHGRVRLCSRQPGTHCARGRFPGVSLPGRAAHPAHTGSFHGAAAGGGRQHYAGAGRQPPRQKPHHPGAGRAGGCAAGVPAAGAEGGR